MVTLIAERIKGVLRVCDAGCYDAKPGSECICICAGRNHAKGVSGLFGEDVPRKEVSLFRRHQQFLEDLRTAAQQGKVYGGIRLDPNARTVSPVEVFIAIPGDGRLRQILHRCNKFKRRSQNCHSPTGFNWGYGGSGPAELARYILADALGDWYFWSPGTYQDFKRRFLVTADDSWLISRADILAWFDELPRHVGRPRRSPIPLESR